MRAGRPLLGALTWRVTLAFLAAVYLVTALLLGGLYLFAVQRPMDEVKAEVTAETRALLRVHAAGGEPALVAALEQRRAMAAPRKAFDALIVDGRAVTGNLPSWPAARANWHRIEADLYRDGDEDDHDALAREVALPGGARLLVGRDVEALADRDEIIHETALWGTLAVTLLGLAGGLLLSRIVSARLARVNQAALKVMAGNLSERIATRGGSDDFDRLSATLNAMLERIEALVGSVSRVSDSIAHELRTPLTRLRATLEELQGSGNARQQAVARRALDEAERLQQVFDALLRIARIETGRHQLQRSPVALNALAEDAVEFYAPEAEARGQRLALRPAAETPIVEADRDLIFQALANLIDNAVKFTPEGGDIAVAVEMRGRRPAVAVRDSGPGVSAETMPRLGERFYRAAETASVCGTGLGLTLVGAVARAHGAALDLTSDSAGFAAALVFPESASNRST